MVVKPACLSDPKSWLAGALAPAMFSHVQLVEIKGLNKVLPHALQDGVWVWDQSFQAYPIETDLGYENHSHF